MQPDLSQLGGGPPLGGGDLGGGPPAGPPSQISVPTDSGQGQPHGPDRGDHTDALNNAISAIEEYISSESDEQDIALARKIMADIAKLRSSQQQLVDKATGAGPGARLLRKSQGADTGGGGGAAGY